MKQDTGSYESEMSWNIKIPLRNPGNQKNYPRKNRCDKFWMCHRSRKNSWTVML